MTKNASNNTPPVNHSNIINESVNCYWCGYNVKGLSSESQCPECGESLRDVPYQDHLKHSDPKWVKSLAVSFQVMISGLLFPPCCSTPMTIMVHNPVAFSRSTIITSVVFISVSAISCWIATTKEPNRKKPVPDDYLRLLARWSMLAYLSVTILGPSALIEYTSLTTFIMSFWIVTQLNAGYWFVRYLRTVVRRTYIENTTNVPTVWLVVFAVVKCSELAWLWLDFELPSKSFELPFVIWFWCEIVFESVTLLLVCLSIGQLRRLFEEADSNLKRNAREKKADIAGER